MYTADKSLEAFVQRLPKTETHLHLEGACPIELLEEYDLKVFGKKPYMWDDDFRYNSFTHFVEVFAQASNAIFNTPEAFHKCAEIVFAKCASQNCRYVECSFDLGVLTRPGMQGPEVIDAILDAAPENLEVRVFIGMRHNAYTPQTAPIIHDSLTWDQLTGIDLHGPEDLPLETWTAEIWRKAAAAGKFCKAHAGEFMPASFVERCVTELGAKRIQHGVRAIEDPAVIQRLKEQAIGLDVCPISNLKLQVEGIPNMRAHPIRQLFDQGVLCTINTDDPLMFGNTLSEEYYALAQDLNFSRAELAQIALNGFKVALWDSNEKDACIQELQEIISESQSV